MLKSSFLSDILGNKPTLIEAPPKQTVHEFAFDEELTELDNYIQDNLQFYSRTKTVYIMIGAVVLISLRAWAYSVSSHFTSIEASVFGALPALAVMMVGCRFIYMWRKKPHRGELHQKLPKQHALTQVLNQVRAKALYEDAVMVNQYLANKQQYYYRDVVNVATLLKQYRNVIL